MFSMSKYLRTSSPGRGDFTDPGLAGAVFILPLGRPPTRRSPIMIVSPAWRRSGPNGNLHDQRGSSPKSARRARVRLRRLGITFWHRPFRPDRASDDNADGK